MSQELYSIEQVADLLGLHVKTVRAYVHDGRLKARRIGKQYRVLRSDLEALTGTDAMSRRTHHIEVSSMVLIDAASPEVAHRVTTTLTATLKAQRGSDTPARVDTVYDETRARLKVIISASAETTSQLLAMIPVIAGAL
jgi:excisionase family DNA binding protein